MFKDLDLAFSFVLAMLSAATLVAAGTQLAAAVTGLRARLLHRAIEELLAAIDPEHLSPCDARQIASLVLRHPWLRGSGGGPASVLSREDFVRLLVEISRGASPAAVRLRDAFGFTGVEEARERGESMGAQALRLELGCPDESPRDRQTKSAIFALGTNPLLARIHTWYGQAMARATARYMLRTRVLTAALALALVLAARLDLLECLHLCSLRPWPGMALSWIFVSLGTPFWYDRLKDLLHLRPSLR